MESILLSILSHRNKASLLFCKMNWGLTYDNIRVIYPYIFSRFIKVEVFVMLFRRVYMLEQKCKCLAGGEY